MIDNKKPFSLRINEKTFELLQQLAKVEKRSINSEIEMIIETYIRDSEKAKSIKIEVNGGTNTFHGNKK